MSGVDKIRLLNEEVRARAKTGQHFFVRSAQEIEWHAVLLAGTGWTGLRERTIPHRAESANASRPKTAQSGGKLTLLTLLHRSRRLRRAEIILTIAIVLLALAILILGIAAFVRIDSDARSA